MTKIRKTISELIMEFFQKHQKEDLEHGAVVDWVEEQYKKLYGKKLRDTCIVNTSESGHRQFVEVKLSAYEGRKSL